MPTQLIGKSKSDDKNEKKNEIDKKKPFNPTFFLI
jgi:hypothetical protein